MDFPLFGAAHVAVMAKKDNAISEYELQRQANIAKNQALLKELQLSAASTGLAAKATKSTRATPSSSRKRQSAPRVKVEDIGPRRTSSRLKGIDADSEIAKRKAEDEHEALRQAEQVKRQRQSEDLRLSDVVVAGQDWDQSGNWLRDIGRGRPYQRTFGAEDVKQTSNKHLRELREKMSSLELWQGIEPARIKITPERIYSMGFHPTEDKALVFAGDKLGNLGLFDASQSFASGATNVDDDEDDEEADEPTPAITTFKTHTRTISTILFAPDQPSNVFTASYDSSIRKLDLAAGLSTEVYAPAETSTDAPISGLAVPPTDPHMLYFTTLEGAFGMHDTRTSSTTPPITLLQMSEKKIGGFSVHPLHPHLLATASLDRTLKLWDLRALKGRGNARRPAIVAQHESRLSISHAAFNAVGQIATSSYDDTIKLHNLHNCSDWTAGHELSDAEFAPATIVSHDNQTGRWVTILRPHWQARPTDVGGGAQRFVIGNMRRFVDVYAGDGQQLAQLGGDGITAVPAVAVFHESRDWVAAGTASGKLALWM